MNKYFKNPTTVEELRKQYRDLLKIYHPDNGGSEEATKQINTEYEQLYKRLQYTHSKAAEEPHESRTESAEMDEVLREAIRKVSHLSGINVEICGTWVWITGDTYAVKDIIKAAGFQWSRNKSAWYFHAGEYRRTGRKKYSMSDIRFRHGSQSVNLEPSPTLG